jgi:hypothetical protein
MPTRRRTLIRSRKRCEDNIKADLRKWFVRLEQNQVRVHWRFGIKLTDTNEGGWSRYIYIYIYIYIYKASPSRLN